MPTHRFASIRRRLGLLSFAVIEARRQKFALTISRVPLKTPESSFSRPSNSSLFSTLITVMPARDPFLANRALARNPEDARSQDNKWLVVMSYAWAIFRHAAETKKSPDAAA